MLWLNAAQAREVTRTRVIMSASATCWVGLPVLSARIGRWLPAWQQCQQQWSTGDCSAQEGGQRWAYDDRGDPSGGQLVTDTALRRRRCSVMQPCGSRVEEGTRRCKHR